MEGAGKMTRDECVSVLKESCRNKNLLKHMFATEAVMKGLAERLGEDTEAGGWKKKSKKGLDSDERSVTIGMLESSLGRDCVG